MDVVFIGLGIFSIGAVITVTLLAGFVKGAVGVGMPMIMISGLASLMPAEAALAALILPTVVANAAQALRQGPEAAMASVRKYRVFLAMLLVFMLFSAQLVRVLPQNLLFLLLGCPVVLFSGTQLMGWQLKFNVRYRQRAEVLIGAFAGLIGGMSGVWGPPTVAYLTALNTEKTEQIRVQGVIYGIGSVMLLAAHMKSGIFRAETAPLSFALLIPALLGMWIGFRLQDRLDKEMFRRLTLVVLIIAGANLIRRGLMG